MVGISGLSTSVNFMLGSLRQIAAAVIHPELPPPTITIELIL
jgi:hypothetical protein